MQQWLMQNLSTILMLIGLIALVAVVVSVMWWDKKRGRHSCGGNCGCCPSGGACSGCAPQEKRSAAKKAV